MICKSYFNKVVFKKTEAKITQPAWSEWPLNDKAGIQTQQA